MIKTGADRAMNFLDDIPDKPYGWDELMAASPATIQMAVDKDDMSFIEHDLEDNFDALDELGDTKTRELYDEVIDDVKNYFGYGQYVYGKIEPFSELLDAIENYKKHFSR